MGCKKKSRLKALVRAAGLEPAQGYPREILSLLCLPIPPCPREVQVIARVLSSVHLL